MNVKRTAALLAGMAILNFPLSVSAQSMLMGAHDGAAPPTPIPGNVQAPGSSGAQSTSSQERSLGQFAREIFSVSGLTKEQKKSFAQGLRAVGAASQGASMEQKAALKLQAEQMLWGGLTAQQQDELKAKNPKMFPPS